MKWWDGTVVEVPPQPLSRDGRGGADNSEFRS